MTHQSGIELPLGDHPNALEFPHFPTLQQAIVWRNWELVPIDRLAKVLRTTSENVLQLARDLGLRVPPVVNRYWLERGYVTIVRNNWHLLPYEQLLELLDWSAERMADVLKNEDGLFYKLGNLKPKCEKVYYSPLTSDQVDRTSKIRVAIEKYFPLETSAEKEPAFAFIETFQKAEPHQPAINHSSRFDLKLVYPYFTVFGDPFLNDKIDLLPDGLLERYARMGINGVWMPGVLYSLVNWEPAPEYSVGFETRIENLRKLVQKTAKHGIGLYMYLNEPRAMPFSFFEKHPDWKGVKDKDWGVTTFCTSHPAVLDLLKRSTQEVFRKVPDLAGVVTISMSEYPTHCHSRWMGHECPRCSKRPVPEVVAEVNRAIEQGVHAAAPKARVIAWAWRWEPEWACQLIDLLPNTISVMCSSEENLPTNIGGIQGSVLDYSISQVGPADFAKSLWQHAQKRGMKTLAKVQINTTWECSALPYIPAVDLVEKHLENLSNSGVGGLMVSWTLGGYPGGNLELLEKSSKQLAVEKFGAGAAPIIRQTWEILSRAFHEFPFDINVVYFGPQSQGPMNLLFLKPTGYTATMVGYAYDDLKTWRSIYPEDIFENQFRILCETWKKGLDHLDLAEPMIDTQHRKAFEDLKSIVWANYCHYRSTCLQIAFIRLRDSESPDKKTRMHAIHDEEIQLAKKLHELAQNDARIGFEATNHYAYSLNDLKEKVLNCQWLRTQL